MSLNNLPPGSLVQMQPPITSRSHHTPSVHWARCLDRSQRVFFNTKVQAGSLKLANVHLKDSKKKTETKNLNSVSVVLQYIVKQWVRKVFEAFCLWIFVLCFLKQLNGLTIGQFITMCASFGALL